MSGQAVRARYGDIRMARILAEDGDFVTLEVAKNDGVTFHLQQNEEGEVVGGDRFLSLLFIRQVGGKTQVWDPWAEDQS